MWNDLRYTLRTLIGTPVFALTAILALSLGIGANTALFSIINSVLWNPPGLTDSDRLVALRVRYEKIANLKSIGTSGADFVDTRDNKKVFASAATMQVSNLAYTGGEVPERLVAAQTSWQWFDTLGTRPLQGRTFQPEEDQPGAGFVTVLSYSLWQRLFGGDPNIVGKTIPLNQQAYKVIGVMPPEARFPPQADLWVPLALEPARYTEQNRHNQFLFTIARLAPGVPFTQASAGTRLMTEEALRKNTSGFSNSAGWGLFIVPLTEFLVGDLKTPMFILLGAVGFVLLIACSNIAGLMLARASGRSKEIAVRVAMGAGKWRLIRQLLTESLVLAAGGGLLGLALGWAAVRLLMRLGPEQLITGLRVSIDPLVLGFTAGVSLLAGLLFGIAPAWQLAKSDHYDALKEGGRSGTAGRAKQMVRSVLVVGEVALALVLLAGAGLLLRSLTQLQEESPGFQPHGVMSASYSLPLPQYKEEDKQIAFHQALGEKLRAIPGVEAAGLGMPLPYGGDNWSGSFEVEGHPQAPGEPGPHGGNRFVDPGYFTAMRIPLLKGRVFTEQDRKGSELVVVIDEPLAQQYWPNEDPIGKLMRRGARSPWATVIGVVAHVNHADLAGDGRKATYYFSLYQTPPPLGSIVLRTAGDPTALTGAIRQAIRQVDPSLPVYDVKSMEERVQGSLGGKRFAARLLQVFAGLAMLLAAIGLYGVISYGVAQRTQEIGIRMALGAERGSVLGLVLWQGLRLAGAGVILGLLAALPLTRFLKSQLFHISPFDPQTFLLTAAVLVLVALAASYVPARRASTVDPVIALRHE